MPRPTVHRNWVPEKIKRSTDEQFVLVDAEPKAKRKPAKKAAKKES